MPPPLDDMPPIKAIPSIGPQQPLGLRATIRIQVTETISTLREVVLMPRDLVPVVPATKAPPSTAHATTRDVVVLIHGFFASAGVWRPMKRKLMHKTGAEVASFTHAPGVGIDRIARSLARLVERIPSPCRVHLVGHSLGGLVARWYVQELGGHTRVTQTISLGSPFGGTVRAHPFPFLVGRELGVSSPLLARLRERAHEHDVPHTSIVGQDDILIVPGESAIFPRGEFFALPRCGHNTLLFHLDSLARVVERVQSFQPK